MAKPMQAGLLLRAAAAADMSAPGGGVKESLQQSRHTFSIGMCTPILTAAIALLGMKVSLWFSF